MWKMKLTAKLGKTQGPVLQCKYAFRTQGWVSLYKDIFVVLGAGKVRMYLLLENRKESLAKYENELPTYMQFLTICQVCPCP